MNRFPARDFDYDYARLIHVGISVRRSPFGGRLGANGEPDEGEERWRAAVGDVWCKEMRRRAAADGLSAECAIEYSTTSSLSPMWLYYVDPVARLARPDGGVYVDEWPSEEALAAMASDWGATLAVARERNPYDFAREIKVEADRIGEIESRRAEYDARRKQFPRYRCGVVPYDSRAR